MPYAAPPCRVVDIRQTFKENLASEWKRKTASKQPYVVADRLRTWMTEEPTNNAARLLKAVSMDSHRQMFLEMTSNRASEGHKCCLLVFGVLLELGHGSLLDVFQKVHIVDRNLAFADRFYPELRRELGEVVPDPEPIIQEFERKKWEFCPATIELGMDEIFRWNMILPFCKRERINTKGGTAELWQVWIQEDLVPSKLRSAISGSRLKDKEFGWCYRMAVKSYKQDGLSTYEEERKCFVGIQSKKGMVQYLGTYAHEGNPDSPSSKTYNILLEYGELDLDEFFAEPHQYPPLLCTEIIEFWRALFNIADAIQRFHNLVFKYEDGQTQHYSGWHADVKPDNILRVNGEFKLADFGFAKFIERTVEKAPTEFMEGGTQTYGPPECDSERRRRGTMTPVLQTIDVWSFGCVLSIAATWVVLGFQGVLQFENMRVLATSKLRERKERGERVSVPAQHDAFHDGQTVLPDVGHWHNYLRNVMRESDTTTARVLDLIDSKMLVKDPSKRCTSTELVKKLREILILAETDHNERSAREDVQPVADTIVKALLDYDRKAPSNSEEVEATRVERAEESRQSAQASRPDQVGTRAGKSLSPTQARRNAKSRRIGKSERLDNISKGKVAHRAVALETDLSDRAKKMETDSARRVSLAQGSSASGAPQICESPVDEDSDAEDGLPRQADFRSHTGHLTDRSESKRRPVDAVFHHPPTPAIETISSNRSAQSHKRVKNGAFTVPQIQTEASQASTSKDLSLRLSNIDTENPNPMAEQSQSQSKAPQVEDNVNATKSSTSSFDDGMGRSRASTTASNLSPKLSELPSSLEIVQVRKALEERAGGFVAQTLSAIGFTPKDDVLKEFVRDRDIVFIVDNSRTMYEFWKDATYTLTTLAWKLEGVDDDGLDLHFTVGSSNNVDGARGKKARNGFKKAMKNACPKPSPLYKTNMCTVLGHFFDRYLRHPMKNMTLIVLTDGRWEGSEDENDVEDKVVEFVNKLLQRSGSKKDRRFSIEFIPFGNDNKAINRMQALDDTLEKKFQIPDIIDMEPWTGSVHKMIMGSFVPYIDREKSGSFPPESPDPPFMSPHTPPTTPPKPHRFSSFFKK